MKGRNEILLNRATMVAAVQHYFDSVLFKETEIEVEEVTFDPSREGGRFRAVVLKEEKST